jgi:diguanylate cyclase (GGDEF)-like protein
MRRHVADSPLQLGDRMLPLQVSIGIATLADGPRDLHDLLREADRALYAAKNAGRNRCVTRSSLARAHATAGCDPAARKD